MFYKEFFVNIIIAPKFTDLYYFLNICVFLLRVLIFFFVDSLGGNLVQCYHSGDVNDMINDLYQVLVTVVITL